MKLKVSELNANIAKQQNDFVIQNATLETKIAYLLSTVQDLTTKYILLNATHSSEVSQLKTRLTELSAKDNHLETTVAALQIQTTSVTGHTQNQTSTGSTYVRWGRKTCPGNGTSLVYSGFAGGSYYSGSGGPADFLCMPPDPIYEVNASTDGNAYVYGVEYQSTVYGSARVDDDMPCSFCKTSRSTVIMLPGRNRCHAGWTLEYHGWLAGGASSQASSEYICLDKQPEALQHSVTNEEGRLLYLVSSQCGSLPCTPYKGGQTLSCAVCSIE
ncbi:short-chain collagen C4-like [Mizuhopecten yessoensis]|uniref:Short-chain collagen C4 n=1 Tax=Mizuhopecten yessoensis TaxID=6573 RepID=A0A210PHA2_MIZYE|nr:short-chain collagen C4-like [Mizuhopecten yessoensis]OWF35860.1 hypothetical protein KP79_PYT24343 [Mizuhopecten yessoensis]